MMHGHKNIKLNKMRYQVSFKVDHEHAWKLRRQCYLWIRSLYHCCCVNVEIKSNINVLRIYCACARLEGNYAGGKLSTNGVGGHGYAPIGFNTRERGTFTHFVRDWMGARVGLVILRSIST